MLIYLKLFFVAIEMTPDVGVDALQFPNISFYVFRVG